MGFDEAGFEIIEGLIDADEAQALLERLSRLELEPLRGGIRRIEQLVPEVAGLARSAKFQSIAGHHLTGTPELVRAIYFDKSPNNNWFVTWHQDRTVAVSTRFEHEEWGPWSLKAGAWHVQPPVEVLDNTVTIRLHLDPANRANGCLKVLAGSHRIGLLPTDAAYGCVEQERVVYCESPVGGAVVMRPHILHASEKATAPLPRRILHFEYSSFKLPQGVTWTT